MKKFRKQKKLLSFILAFAMVAILLPYAAIADDTNSTQTDEAQVVETVDTEDQTTDEVYVDDSSDTQEVSQTSEDTTIDEASDTTETEDVVDDTKSSTSNTQSKNSTIQSVDSEDGYTITITNNSDADDTLKYRVYVFDEDGNEIKYIRYVPELKTLNTDCYLSSSSGWCSGNFTGVYTSYKTIYYSFDLEEGKSQTITLPADYMYVIEQDSYTAMSSVKATVNGVETEGCEGTDKAKNYVSYGVKYGTYSENYYLPKTALTENTNIIFNNTYRKSNEQTTINNGGKTFHLMTSTDDIVLGAHYIIVAADTSNALTVNANDVQESGEVSGVGATTTKLNGYSYTSDGTPSDTITISQSDISDGKYVFTCSSTGAGGDGLKLRSNVKDSETGKNYILKLGSGSFSYLPMFTTSGGALKLIQYDNSDNSFMLCHNTNGRNDGPKLTYIDDDEYSIYPTFMTSYWARYRYNDSDKLDYTYATGTQELYIYTDAEQTTIETGVNRTYTELTRDNLFENVLDSSSQLLFTYTDDNGKEYALTVEGPKEVTAKEVTSEDGTDTYVTTDKGYGWNNTNGTKLADENISTYQICMQIVQSKFYLWMSASGLATTEEVKNSYLEIESPMNVDGTYDSDTLYLYIHGGGSDVTENPDRYLGWDSTTNTFTTGNDKEHAIKIKVYGYKSNTYENFSKLTDLSKIKDYESFIIVYKDSDGNRYVLDNSGSVHTPYGSSSYGYENTDQTSRLYGYTPFIEVEENNGIITTKRTNAITLGDISSQQSSNTDTCKWWNYATARFNAGDGQNLYLGNTLQANNIPNTVTTSVDKTIRIAYNSDKSAFNIRGNSGSQWLSITNDYTVNWNYDSTTRQWTTETVAGKVAQVVSSQKEATDFEIYVKVSSETTNIVYHDENGDVTDQYAVQKDLTLPQKDDIEKDGTTYTFVGWSTNADYAGDDGFLSMNESCDLYDYYDTKDLGRIKASVAEKYDLVGMCNPDAVNTVSTDDLETDSNGKVNLYPIYAVRGTDTAITANDVTNDSSTAIVGVSDWKKLQSDEHSFADSEKEKWLGKIKVEVYKDGELWGDSQYMYFDYHNDDAVDLNIKFVWDNLVEEQEGDTYEEKLYNYMANTDIFPDYDQEGHFVIDGVYAEQGGSQDGLYYSLNWITNHGGQLDNVKGGSTVKIYVTTKYNVEYYLDDELITESDWTNDNYYTTKGTETKFNEDTKDVEFAVTSNNLNGLMDPDVTSVDDSETFAPDVDDFARSEYNEFSYFIKDYDHSIPIAKTPKSLVQSGRELSSTSWQLKDADGNVVENINWSSTYDITGGAYGTGNTVNAYKDVIDDTPEADSAYTYHLYAYTKATSSDIHGDEGGDSNKDNGNNDKKDSKSNSDNTNNPDTGDTTNFVLWLSLLAISGVAIFGFISKKRMTK